jgi:hypothetical protein
MAGGGSNRLRAGRLSRPRPDGSAGKCLVTGCLWKWTALMRFAHFPTIKSVHSNVPEIRLHSRKVFGVPMEN